MNHYFISALEPEGAVPPQGSSDSRMGEPYGPMPARASEPSGFKQVLKAATFSMLIFGVGFFSLNAAAYGDIIKASLLDIGAPQVDVAVEATGGRDVTGGGITEGEGNVPDEWALMGESSEEPEQELLVVENNPGAQKSQIPPLNLEVTPPDNRLIIPKLGDKNVPIISTNPEQLIGADWKSLEKTFQSDLQKGVVHYPGTAEPGEVGNVFITGHSSYYPWDPGRFKTVFSLLSRVEVGDEIIVFHDQKKHRYIVRETKEVKNSDVSVLNQPDNEKILTLMTCTPVGTQFRRLVVIAEEVEG